MVDFSNLIQIAWNIGLWVVIIIVGGILVALLGIGTWLILQAKTWKEFEVLIVRKYKDQAGNIIWTKRGTDRGRIFFDKKLNRYYFQVRRARVVLGDPERNPELKDKFKIDNQTGKDSEFKIPYMLCDNGKKLVVLEYLGIKKYAFGNIDYSSDVLKVNVTHADMAEQIRGYKLAVKTYSKKNDQLWAFAIYALVCVLILILMIVLMNHLDMMKAVSSNFAQGMNSMAQAKSNVVPVNVPH